MACRFCEQLVSRFSHSYIDVKLFQMRPLISTCVRNGSSWLEKRASLPADIDLSSSSKLHIPVMSKEVVTFVDPQPGKVIIDMTCGAGGHSEQLLNAAENVKIFGLDRDPNAIEILQKLKDKYSGRFFPLLGKFSEAKDLLAERGVTQVDGILFDLGCSSMQLDTGSRGFSISNDGPLDMRMDGGRIPNQLTAAQILQHIEEEDLAKVLKVYGEEKYAKRIARAIVEARYLFKSLKTTKELAAVISTAVTGDDRHDMLGRWAHVATKSFQAIRILVNNELNELNRGMEIAHEILKPGGTLVTLSFHSLEDRIVKRHLLGIDMDEPISKTMSQKYRNASSWHTEDGLNAIFDKKWSVVNKHVLVPEKEEVSINPRSRSAKLRCARKNDIN